MRCHLVITPSATGAPIAQKTLQESKQSAPKQVERFSDILEIAINLSDESSVDLSDSICQVTVNEVIMAVQEAVFRSVADKTPISQNWKTVRPLVTAEVAYILTNIFNATHPLETAVTGKDIPIMTEAQENFNPDVVMCTIVVVLDGVDGNRGTKSDLVLASTNAEQNFTCTTHFLGERNQKPQVAQFSAFKHLAYSSEDSGLSSDWSCTIYGFFNVEKHPGMEGSVSPCDGGICLEEISSTQNGAVNAESSSSIQPRTLGSFLDASVARSPATSADIQTFTTGLKPVVVKRHVVPFTARMNAPKFYVNWKKSKKSQHAGLVSDVQKRSKASEISSTQNVSVNAESSFGSFLDSSVATFPTSADIQTLMRTYGLKPVVVKRHVVPFTARMNVPKFYVNWKKSNKMHHAGLVSDVQKRSKASDHLQESSHIETNTFCKRLSRMCSAISKALSNPFKCFGRAS
ncbi:uncharacterized protein LOC143478414 [Brachyhypopomus gauderio]|uniref:uncharacterized protein LOC143478414 n=1 Tax=Brachyhypopomus gauderio TaxID=698409 RepID=UPI0040435F0E